jgi:hypothetical protein
VGKGHRLLASKEKIVRKRKEQLTRQLVKFYVT